MTARQVLIGVGLVGAGIAIGALGAHWLDGRGEHGEEAGGQTETNATHEPEPVALVKTVVALEETLSPTVEALGSAVVPPTLISVVSWPVELAVSRVMVVQGQTVEKDAPLLAVSLSRDAELQLSLAKQAVESTGRALETAQARGERGLATRQELIAAQGAADEARQRLERLKNAAVPGDGLIHAPVQGVVQTVRAQAGGVVPANGSLVELAPVGAVVAQLGVEPADIGSLKVGQHVMLAPADLRDTSRYEGSVWIIAPAVNPATGLGDAYVTLEGSGVPRPGTLLRAELALPEVRGLVVPRMAVIPDDEEEVVFVVRDGKAVRVPVSVGRRFHDHVEITKGIAWGDQVVVMGQWQLTDGAPVRQEGDGGGR